MEPSRCWAFVYDYNLQGTHCHDRTTYPGSWFALANGDSWWHVWSCEHHLD